MKASDLLRKHLPASQLLARHAEPAAAWYTPGHEPAYFPWPPEIRVVLIRLQSEGWMLARDGYPPQQRYLAIDSRIEGDQARARYAVLERQAPHGLFTVSIEVNPGLPRYDAGGMFLPADGSRPVATCSYLSFAPGEEKAAARYLLGCATGPGYDPYPWARWDRESRAAGIDPSARGLLAVTRERDLRRASNPQGGSKSTGDLATGRPRGLATLAFHGEVVPAAEAAATLAGIDRASARRWLAAHAIGPRDLAFRLDAVQPGRLGETALLAALRQAIAWGRRHGAVATLARLPMRLSPWQEAGFRLLGDGSIVIARAR